MSVAWVLNLDAEDELAHRGAHTPSVASVARVERAVAGLKGLVREGDVVVWPGGASANGLEGCAWCPTRWALEQLVKAGARVPLAPSMDVLRRVNHRAFNAALGASLPGAEFVTTWSSLEAMLARGGPWLAKRAFGYAGRGRKKLEGTRLTDEERAWVEASLGEGLQVEPWVERSLDAALHGAIAPGGDVRFGAPTVQLVDAFGAWQGSRVAAGELRDDEVGLLRREAERAAEALIAAGYFGPFGIDAFRWTGGFQPRSEINARYSMGWAVGMGLMR